MFSCYLFKAVLWSFFLYCVHTHDLCVYFKCNFDEITSHSSHLNKTLLPLVAIALKSVGCVENRSQRLGSGLQNKVAWKNEARGHDKRWSSFNFPFCGAGSLTPKALWQLLNLETFHYTSIQKLLSLFCKCMFYIGFCPFWLSQN